MPNGRQMTQRRRTVISLAGLIAVSLIIFVVTLPRPSHKGRQEPGQAEQSVSPESSDSPSVQSQKGIGGTSSEALQQESFPRASPKELEVGSVRSWAPDLETVREEVSQNPHSTPQSLVRFAEKLGPLMERALQEVTFAEKLAEEFQLCAWDESIPTSARALCLSDAENLANVHLSLREKTNEIRRGASQEVIRLVDSSRVFKKSNLRQRAAVRSEQQ